MTLKIIKPGVVFINGNDITISHFHFDTSGLASEVTKDQITACARDYVAQQFAKVLGAAAPAIEECSVSPVTMSNEREAEMEAYLLINRCQGNS
jgi:hypothetical protein